MAQNVHGIRNTEDKSDNMDLSSTSLKHLTVLVILLLRGKGIREFVDALIMLKLVHSHQSMCKVTQV